jgi:hypothetical protein
MIKLSYNTGIHLPGFNRSFQYSVQIFNAGKSTRLIPKHGMQYSPELRPTDKETRLNMHFIKKWSLANYIIQTTQVLFTELFKI